MVNEEYIVGHEGTARLGNIALACKKHLQEFSKNETPPKDAVNAGEENWASRQYKEFNDWFHMIGMFHGGPRAIHVRLNPFPGIFKIHGQLLLSLEDDLKELQQSLKAPEHVVNIDESVYHAQLDSSSLFCTSLPSSDESQAGAASSGSEKRNAELRKQIEDTISQLQDHRLTIGYVLREHEERPSLITPSDIETFIIENAKGVFTLARLNVNQGLKLERNGITQDAIIEELTSTRPILDLYRDFIERKGSLSSSIRDIREAFDQLHADNDAEVSFKDTHGQTLSGFQKWIVKTMVEPLPDDSPLILPVFLSLQRKDININFKELNWAQLPREKHWPMYKQSNKRMDHYEDYRPWEHNRVKLQVPENKYDYVNASPITLTSSDPYPKYAPMRYIAMQGPTKSSFDHVWRMVAEQTLSPAIIVQLTEMADKDGRKCDQYLPMAEEDTSWTINDDNIWGDNWQAYLNFRSLEIIAGGAIEKRMVVMRIYKEGEEEEERIIWHFLYKRWPDYGVPTADDINSLLKLMELSKQYSPPNSKCIVHCSAGVGRTGCFIALDHLIRELDFGVLRRYDMMWEGRDLIHKTVDILRQQRWGMVQTDEQYQFIHQVMRKLWYDKYGVADENADNHE